MNYHKETTMTTSTQATGTRRDAIVTAIALGFWVNAGYGAGADLARIPSAEQIDALYLKGTPLNDDIEYWEDLEEWAIREARPLVSEEGWWVDEAHCAFGITNSVIQDAASRAVAMVRDAKDGIHTANDSLVESMRWHVDQIEREAAGLLREAMAAEHGA